MPGHIEVRGARVHNLRDVNVDVPLGCFVGIAGVSGSGKSSLALGVLYAEGSRRYLEALSTYTRRRLTQASRASVDDVRYVPAALALHQRPAVPGIRSTFGTSTELLNSLRLMFSRLGSYRCPNGHWCPPGMNEALMTPYVCPECGVEFYGQGAEELAFNSDGACPACQGTGIVRTPDESTYVPDESLTIEEGAVAPWNQLMWSVMVTVCKEMGVRIDVPFCELTPEEREIVFHGPLEKRHILYKAKNSDTFAEMDFTFYSAENTVLNSLAKAKDEKGLRRVGKFLKEGACPDCGGTRLSEKARSVRLRGLTLDEATAMTLSDLIEWVGGVPEACPEALRPMARDICDSFLETARRLIDLGLGYLSLDRSSATLSTGERQRVQLARAVRNRTTGVLYVLDEPSIGLHPANVDGLLEVVGDLVADGNSVVMVDHDVRILRRADWLIEMGPGAGALGGRVLSQGTPAQVGEAHDSRIGGFLSGELDVCARSRCAADEVFGLGRIHLETEALHTVRPLAVDVPRGRLTCVTGVSGSGKTTLVLESLIPALQASAAGDRLPEHVRLIEAPGIARTSLIDATPIGINVRSTVATYSGVMDELRRAYARTEGAKAAGKKTADFSYNTGSLRCATCDGTGSISLDVQFLPDVDIVCPDCRGSRFAPLAYQIKRTPKAGKRGKAAQAAAAEPLSLPELLTLTVDQALEATRDLPKVASRLQTLSDLGLGYLTLGEATPALSGGEAQRLKLASEMGRAQDDAVFVFDEPSIGLHPLDVQTLLGVLDRLVCAGATVIVIEHDLDMISQADYVIDMGPGGGEQGGRVVVAGTPEQVAACGESVTGRYL